MKENGDDIMVTSDEQVARLVSEEWVEDGVLLVQAFELAPKETYLSVNRLSVATYHEDVEIFLKKHPSYCSVKDARSYRRALLDVGKVRGIHVKFGDDVLDINVEVEPRNNHTLSHAGIFVRSGNQNVTKGRQLFSSTLPTGISSDDILLEVQWALRNISVLQECKRHFNTTTL